MKIKSFLAVCMATLVSVGTMPTIPVSAASTIKIYVSPNGKDTNNGLTPAYPLATLQAAKTKIRNVTKNSPIEIIFAEGTYRFDSTVDFGASDSGKSNASITYKAADGAKVFFTNSVKLDSKKFVKVQNNDILEKLPDTARNNVYCLDLAEQGIGEIPKFKPSQSKIIAEDVSFYFDGYKQMPAQWPNGKDNYATFNKAINVGGNGLEGAGGKFSYTDSNPDKWVTADDFYIEGYFSHDYRHERVAGKCVDAVNKTIELAYGTDLGVVSTESKRYKGVHLIEELDIPSEWYLDRENRMLYYYPPKNPVGADFEIAYSTDSLFNLLNVSYVNFENINFERIRGTVLYGAQDIKNVYICGCTFKNVGKGIYFRGNSTGAVETSYINGAYNCRIENNTFAFTDKLALEISGGNRVTLTPSGNVIKNNYFYRCSDEQRTYGMIWLDYGDGDEFSHNIVHNGSFHGLNYSGNDYLIENNEFYNLTRASSDVGMVYSGRSFTERGTKIIHNYLHDNYPVDSRIKNSNNAIYWDDTLNGQLAENNIFENVHRGICSNGMQDSKVLNNTFINCQYATHLNVNFLDSQDTKDLQSNGYDSVKNNAAYIAAYPNMQALAACGLAKFNTVKDNIAYNSDFTIASQVSTYGSVSNNTVSDLPLNPDLSGIGLEETNGEFDTPKLLYSPFKTVYPQNNKDIHSKTIEFHWEDSIGADKYKLIIAKDANFDNIYKEVQADYNYCTVDGFEEDSGIYYWKVIAINTSHQLQNTWQSENVSVFSIEDAYEAPREVLGENRVTPIELKNCNSIMYINKSWATFTNKYEQYIYGCHNLYTYIHKDTMKSLLDANGMLISKNTGLKYDFSKVLQNGQVLSAIITANAYLDSKGEVQLKYENSQRTIELPKKNYSKINFIATARGFRDSSVDIPDYKVRVNYSDNSYDDFNLTIHGRDTDYNVIASPNLIMGNNTDASSSVFKMHEYSLDVDKDKLAVSVTFIGNDNGVDEEGAKKPATPISVFAMTGYMRLESLNTVFDISGSCNSIAAATASSYGNRDELDRFGSAYQFDETYILNHLDSDLQIMSNGIVYSFKTLRNSQKAISSNAPTEICTGKEHYSRIGFVAANYTTSGSIADYPVTLKYSDGSSETKYVKIGANNTTTEGCRDLMGNVQARLSWDGSIAVAARLYSVEIEPNKDKLLKSVVFGDKNYDKNRIFIFAVSGVGVDGLECYDVHFEDNNGEIIDDISEYAGKKVYLAFTSKSKADCSFMLCDYNDGRLERVESHDCKTGINDVKVEYTVDSNFNAKSLVRGLFWDMEEMRPLARKMLLN